MLGGVHSADISASAFTLALHSALTSGGSTSPRHSPLHMTVAFALGGVQDTRPEHSALPGLNVHSPRHSPSQLPAASRLQRPVHVPPQLPPARTSHSPVQLPP